MGADFGGADGAFEDGGDLGEGEFLEAGEEEDFAVVVVEVGEGGAEERVVVTIDGVFGGVRGVVGVVVEIGGIGGAGGAVTFSEVIGGAVAGEAIHPGGETAVVAVGVAVFQHALEDGLRDVFGGGAVAGVFDEETKERAVVALEEFAERIEFAVADGEHERVIGGRGCEGVHGGGESGEVSCGRKRMNTDF